MTSKCCLSFLSKSVKISEAQWVYKRVWFSSPFEMEFKATNLPNHLGYKSVWLKKSFPDYKKVQKCVNCLEKRGVKVQSKEYQPLSQLDNDVTTFC